jgi:nitroreductase
MEAEFAPCPEPTPRAARPEQALREFHEQLRRRRSVRQFSDEPVPRELVELLVRCAASAPSGANKQPWRFVCVSDPALKREIRLGAEAEEREFYSSRASERWLADLAPLGTDADKGFLEVAPWLVVVFKLAREDDGGQVYYAEESVGIATGMLLAAAQQVGLATLVHTPSPMAFLQRILARGPHEKPFVLVPIGWPADGLRVPLAALRKKPIERVLEWREAPADGPRNVNSI